MRGTRAKQIREEIGYVFTHKATFKIHEQTKTLIRGDGHMEYRRAKKCWTRYGRYD